MWKYLLLVFISATISLASEKDTATKIVQTITATIDKDNKLVWMKKDDKHIAEFLHTDSFDISHDCQNVGVIVIKEATPLAGACKDKPILVLDYDLLKIYDNAVAAFFWKKGRPNIVFIKDRIEKFEIILPPSYEIYQEETIW